MGLSIEKIAIVMPVYNEEACIESVIHSWIQSLALHVERQNIRFILVNDGSRDGTGAILDRLALTIPELIVVHQDNQGHGQAVLRGYREAARLDVDWVFQVDSDDQIQADQFPLLWERRHASQFILGHRQKRHDPLHRIVINRIMRLWVILIFQCHIIDPNIPFRLFRRRFLERLLDVLPRNFFAPNIFLSILAIRSGENPINVPIRHEERQTGTVSIVRWKLIKVCLRSALELFLFRLRLSHSIQEIRAK